MFFRYGMTRKQAPQIVVAPAPSLYPAAVKLGAHSQRGAGALGTVVAQSVQRSQGDVMCRFPASLEDRMEARVAVSAQVTKLRVLAFS